MEKMNNAANIESAGTSFYTSLQDAADEISLDNRLAGTTFSLAIRHAETGKLIYGKNEEIGVTPASSLKILTTAAALETLGENYRFSTAVLMDGYIDKETLHGNLYLRGQGDPTLRRLDLDNFAAILKKHGVKKITGNLIGDDTWFDAVQLSPGISKDDESYYYAARVSALNLSPNTDFDTGAIKVDAKPSRVGQPAKIIMGPDAEFMEVDNQSITVTRGEIDTLVVAREWNTNKIIVTGKVPLGSPGTKEWITVPQPTMYTLYNFKFALVEQHIHFSETSNILIGKVPGDAHLLVSKNSMPLKKLLLPFMKLSNNSHAEVLAKEMGKVVFGDGSWESGLLVMKNFLSSAGLATDQWIFEDASGMSHANKIAASELTKLLYLVRSRPWFPHFLKSLPVAGAPERLVGGTLRKRFKGTASTANVLAKTGTLTEVSSLSGYAKTKDGEWLVFAFLTQDSSVPTIPTIDRLVEAITRSRRQIR
ncbi:D-alanyl-D-alanine carboxypeptidase/D-alanyl-D-alanine-endopeptidase [Planococcus sp. N028]|uniref:D-alanyl-D-alanine carboxypeptidase/D-alanyl-D-alanine-endopeptidase n=1 Tax=Planococcus shixiaomingii TaxID=3058393 RepID=A0ABT8N2C1_9BACL|nr:D-alanyl-D-alanine carboxypeptidase/D-alanyl-D-alanine-endopeptidase [Planococcus sp. N028]MDN7242028.1 D-alanyl-D-alanine carboxypeptidase/D-alanyl-D-alanine-endopeptidase [Planococcus sp. N028]